MSADDVPETEGDIETAEDYQAFYNDVGTPGLRHNQYTDGKAEAAELVIEGGIQSSTALLAEAEERYQASDGRSVERAVAKGMMDAVAELAELGALDEDADDEAEVEPEDDGDEHDDEAAEEETEYETEEGVQIEGGGVEIDADEV